MKTPKVLSLVFCFTLVISCGVSHTPELNREWTKVVSSEAGFAATFPCDPSKIKKLFQEEPKEAHLYTFKCNLQGIDFSVSLPESFRDFEPNKAEEDLQNLGQVLKDSVGDEAEVKSTGRVIQSMKGMEFEVDSGNVFGRQLPIAHPRGMYGVQAFGRYDNDTERSRVDQLSRKFIDSFLLIEN